MLQHTVGINPETGLAFPFRAEMRPDVQASASVMKFCLRAEVFAKAGVGVVFIGLGLGKGRVSGVGGGELCVMVCRWRVLRGGWSYASQMRSAALVFRSYQ